MDLPAKTCIVAALAASRKPSWCETEMVDHSAKSQAAPALNRFGMGPRLAAIAAIASDPRGALLAEPERPGIARLAAALPTSAQAFRALADPNAARQARQIILARARQERARQSAASPTESAEAGAETAQKMAVEVPDPGRQICLIPAGEDPDTAANSHSITASLSLGRKGSVAAVARADSAQQGLALLFHVCRLSKEVAHDLSPAAA
jgi:uncharacterized protein (DUF1800 family)